MVIIGPEAAGLARRLGLAPFAALFELCLVAGEGPDGPVAAVGVRELAARLGLNKDTAARAVGVLVDAGVVARERIVVGGGPTRSGYRLRLPLGVSRGVSGCLGREASPGHVKTTAAPTDGQPVVSVPSPNLSDQIGRCPMGADAASRPPLSDSATSPTSSDTAGGASGAEGVGSRSAAGAEDPSRDSDLCEGLSRSQTRTEEFHDSGAGQAQAHAQGRLFVLPALDETEPNT